jgi:triosephosphate isomerase
MGETDAMVAAKLRAAQRDGLTPIVCVGETLAEREKGDTEAVLVRQVTVAYHGLTATAAGATAIAYEPVWAIGTGKTATPEMAQEAHAFVKSLLGAPVLYGGSVTPGNAADLLAQPDVDGALVGGASLEPDSFAAICRAAADIRS